MPGPIFECENDQEDVTPEDAVKYVAQNATEAQKLQAQKNIGVDFTPPIMPDWGEQLLTKLDF